MAYYLVTAKPIENKMSDLRDLLDSERITEMNPFGNTLHHSLENAKLLPNGTAIWEELDYCSPPLAMEREAVLDEYFTELNVEVVDEGEGWEKIDQLPSLWSEYS